MALPEFRKSFAAKATALGLTAAAVVTPLSYSFADDAGKAQLVPASVQVEQISLVEDAGLAAGLHSEQNPGIAVAVYLGTHSTTPTPERIQEVLTGDFKTAGLSDPVTFFFEQNDQAGSVASFYFAGDMNGPYTLGQSRDEAAATVNTYNWRKDNGLLASVSYQQNRFEN